MITVWSGTSIIGEYMAKGSHVWPFERPGAYISNLASIIVNAELNGYSVHIIPIDDTSVGR